MNDLNDLLQRPSRGHRVVQTVLGQRRATSYSAHIVSIWSIVVIELRFGGAVQNGGYRAPYLGSAATVRDESRGSRESSGAAMASISSPT